MKKSTPAEKCESSKPITQSEADEKLIKEYIQKLDDALFHWSIIKHGSILTKEQYLIRYGENKVRAESEKEIAELKAEIEKLKKEKIEFIDLLNKTYFGTDFRWNCVKDCQNVVKQFDKIRKEVE